MDRETTMADARPACPSCGHALDLNRYVSLMVLSREWALFTLECEACGQTVSSVEAIPASLHEEIESAAREVHAGMGVARHDDGQPPQCE